MAEAKNSRSIVEPVKALAAAFEEFGILSEMAASDGEAQVLPEIEALLPRFTGEIMHSRDYRSVKQLMDKVVVVVGAGNSACDIVVDATSVARGSSRMPGTW